MGIISGRSLIDLQSKVSIPHLFLAGNHGMEWMKDNQVTHCNLDLQTQNSLKQVQIYCADIKKMFPALIIEDKVKSIVIHTRGLDTNTKRRFMRYWKKIIQPLLIPLNLVVLQGKMVYEMRPNNGWDKGTLIKSIFHDATPLIYIGDDQTDEDVFRLNSHEITIRVGKLSVSQAQFYVKSVADVARFLQWISNILEVQL